MAMAAGTKIHGKPWCVLAAALRLVAGAALGAGADVATLGALDGAGEATLAGGGDARNEPDDPNDCVGVGICVRVEPCPRS